MTNEFLFSHESKLIFKNQFVEKLQELIKPSTEYLYVHSGIDFGVPNSKVARSYLLSELYDSIRLATRANLIFPSYTFSFCNNEVFDVVKTKSRMGVLSEFVRAQDFSLNSSDPLMSNSFVGTKISVFDKQSKASLGDDSTFKILSLLPNVEFLFFGVKLSDCFTYMHFLEKEADVSYRYERVFSGNIVDPQSGLIKASEHSLYVRYSNAKPSNGSEKFEKRLQNESVAHTLTLGNSSLTIVDKDLSSIIFNEMLAQNPKEFINADFKENEKTKHFTVPQGGMISL